MKLPRSFQLLGQEWTVELVPEKDWVDDEVAGYCLQERYAILIRANQNDQAKQHTFCHELAHAILHRMGEDDLDADEQFVDLLGSMFHQVWASCK